MTSQKQSVGSADSRKPFRVHLPGFIREDVGLGEVFKRATSSFGIRPCGGCERRASTLNSWMVFTGKRGPY